MSKSSEVVDTFMLTYLRRVSLIKSSSSFEPWRQSFLARLESAVTPTGIQAATVAYKSFGDRITRMMILELKSRADCFDQGGQWSLIRARQRLVELRKEVMVLIKSFDFLVPPISTTSSEPPQDQQQQHDGYTKLDMSVVMLRDNLSLYCRLVLCDQSLKRLQASALQLCDKKTVHAIELFRRTFEVFCVMAEEMGLFTFMPETQAASKKKSVSFRENIVLATTSSSAQVVDPERRDDDADDDDYEEKEEEENYHCWFCKNAAVNGDTSMFCYVANSRKTGDQSVHHPGGSNSATNQPENELNNIHNSKRITV